MTERLRSLERYHVGSGLGKRAKSSMMQWRCGHAPWKLTQEAWACTISPKPSKTAGLSHVDCSEPFVAVGFGLVVRLFELEGGFETGGMSVLRTRSPVEGEE